MRKRGERSKVTKLSICCGSRSQTASLMVQSLLLALTFVTLRNGEFTVNSGTERMSPSFLKAPWKLVLLRILLIAVTSCANGEALPLAPTGWMTTGGKFVPG